MIVPDASAVVELITNGPLASAVLTVLEGDGESMLVPHLLDIEVVSALRGMTRAGVINLDRAGLALEALSEFPAERCAHDVLLQRAWELRNNFTAYDATYVALAELADAVLVTCDSKLQKGHGARVLVIR